MTENKLYKGSLLSFQEAVNIASIVSVTDVKGNIIYANEKFCVVSKYTLEELIGKNHRILNSGYHPPEFFKTLWKTILSGKHWRGQIRNKAKDGSYYWVDSVITPVFDENKQISQFLSIRNIITTQKENENLKKSVFATLKEGIAVIDSKGILIYTNKAWNDYATSHEGFNHCAVLNTNLIETCKQSIANKNTYAEKVLEGIDSILNKSKTEFETQIPTITEEETTYTNVRLTPFADGGVVLSLYDITKEKKYQLELIENKDKLISLSAKVARLGYWEANISDSSINATNESLQIFENEDIHTLEDSMEMIAPEDRIHVMQSFADMYRGIYYPFSYRIITPSGNLKWLHTTPAGTTTINGKLIIYGTTQDITDVKRNETALEQSLDELNDRYNELMQFSYIVSHNLRSPIVNLISLSETLQYPELKKEEIDELLYHINDVSHKLEGVTRDLAQVLSTRSTLNKIKEMVTFRDILDRVIATLELQIKECDADIFIDINPRDLEIFTIKSYLESICHNLISNSLKYSDKTRRPEIKISIQKSPEGTYTLIFADNGLGIDLELYKDKIFKIYQRFHTLQEGKGLGLYMTQVQTEALGGKIGIESTPGLGTTFTLTFQNP